MFGYSRSRRIDNREGYDQKQGFGKPIREVQENFPRKLLDQRCQEYGITETVRSKMLPGDHYWRMWREGECPRVRAMAGFRLPWVRTVRYSRILYARLREITGHIEPVRGHDSVFGHEIRQLLLLACTEVESAWTSILEGSWEGCERPTTKHYSRLCAPMRLSEWKVELSATPEYGELSPFADWDPNTSTKSIPWYDAYNATKHDRERSLERATFGDMLNALAAVFIMTIAQFGTEHIDGDSEFQADEFHVLRSPTFPLDELYIRPLAMPGSDNVGQWTGVAHPDVPWEEPT